MTSLSAPEADAADAVVHALAKSGAFLLTAESCTGGMIASRIVGIPGASDVFYEGLVTYSNAAKIHRLGVPEQTLAVHGAVSAQTACAMAEGLVRGRDFAGRTAYGLATTGVAGPDGGTPDKPVGTVWIACAQCAPGCCRTRYYRFFLNADRNTIRANAAAAALKLVLDMCTNQPLAPGMEETPWSTA